MSTSKMDNSGVFDAAHFTIREANLTVPYQSIRFRKNGLEFASEQPFNLWTEVLIDLHSPDDGRRVSGAGVVVDCQGRGNGEHWVSVLLMGLSSTAASHLEHLASSAPVV